MTGSEPRVGLSSSFLPQEIIKGLQTEEDLSATPQPRTSPESPNDIPHNHFQSVLKKIYLLLSPASSTATSSTAIVNVEVYPSSEHENIPPQLVLF